MKLIRNDSDEDLSDVFESEQYQKLRAFLDSEYSTKTIYPLPQHIY